jgi:hypothetical protein
MRRAREKYPERKMLSRAKDRARKLGLPFEITVDDIVVPKICPVLGIPLRVGEELFTDNSPSLDRIDPQRGYVKDNVVVLPYRANRIKNNGTLEELEKNS